MMKSLKLQANLVQVILEACANETTFSELGYLLDYAYLRRDTLKRYLFFLIEYDLISYRGGDKIFVITKKGWDVLSTASRTDLKSIVLE
jgi:predicted transcriptional regulator